jgi:hypothetical protein
MYVLYLGLHYEQTWKYSETREHFSNFSYFSERVLSFIIPAVYVRAWKSETNVTNTDFILDFFLSYDKRGKKTKTWYEKVKNHSQREHSRQIHKRNPI